MCLFLLHLGSLCCLYLLQLTTRWVIFQLLSFLFSVSDFNSAKALCSAAMANTNMWPCDMCMWFHVHTQGNWYLFTRVVQVPAEVRMLMCTSSVVNINLPGHLWQAYDNERAHVYYLQLRRVQNHPISKTGWSPNVRILSLSVLPTGKYRIVAEWFSLWSFCRAKFKYQLLTRLQHDAVIVPDARHLETRSLCKMAYEPKTRLLLQSHPVWKHEKKVGGYWDCDVLKPFHLNIIEPGATRTNYFPPIKPPSRMNNTW